MHDFAIAQGFNDITVLYCRHCGESYTLHAMNDSDDTTYWQKMDFRKSADEFIDPPADCPAQNQGWKGMR